MLAKEYAEQARPLREVDIRALHQIAVPSEAFAGEYRSEPVEIAGSTHVPRTLRTSPRQMEQLVAWLNETSSLPRLAACVVHSWLTIIHPFKDGNGRVARLLANAVLLRAGWPSLIVRASDRLQYLDALSASDEGGDLLPLFDLFVKTIVYSLSELEKPDLAEKLFGIDLQRQPDQRFHGLGSAAHRVSRRPFVLNSLQTVSFSIDWLFHLPQRCSCWKSAGLLRILGWPRCDTAMDATFFSGSDS